MSTDISQLELPATTSHLKKRTLEPLLRFPFIHSLANPCGFALDSSSFPTIQSWLTERQVNHFETTPAPLGSLRTVDLSSLAEQALVFLGPFREILSASNGRRYSSSYTTEDHSLTEELKLVISEAVHLIRRIYAPSVRFFDIRFALSYAIQLVVQKALHKCGGFHLQSLPQEDLIVSPTVWKMKTFYIDVSSSFGVIGRHPTGRSLSHSDDLIDSFAFNDSRCLRISSILPVGELRPTSKHTTVGLI